MKKFLFVLSILFSTFLLSHKVLADTNDITLSKYYGDSSFDYLSLVSQDISNNSSDLSLLLSYYNSNLSNDYPFYILVCGSTSSSFGYSLLAFPSAFPFKLQYYTSSQGNDIDDVVNFLIPFDFIEVSFNNDHVITEDERSSIWRGLYTGPNHYTGRSPIISTNLSLSISSVENNNSTLINDYTFTFPPALATDYHNFIPMFTVGVGSNWPTFLELFDGSYTPSVNYTEVNLNSYSYIALSLKNYNLEAFDTTFMVKGQLCLTPVYNYGMKQKTEYYSGYQVDRCSPVYDTFTPNRISILTQDIENNSIYYLKAYDTTIDNIVKVDTNVFDITYITSENANNPNVIIGGRSYPTIPYNDLSSSATISEEEGYISGESKNVFDISSDSSFIDNLFSNPLQTLGNVWTSIVTMFALVGSFIALLPATLQTFLIAGFSIAIVLGILKILL